jgi:hypothetical protein
VTSKELLASRYSSSLRDRDITAYFLGDQGKALHAALGSIRDLIDRRKKMGRHRLAKVCSAGNNPEIFVKTARIESLPSRLRISLGLKRRSGAYDWALAELHNNINASQRTNLIPRLIGYGFIKRNFGLVSEVFLAYENLANHVDGLAWTRKNPPKIELFIQASLNLIITLNRQGIHHLDLWVANIMLPTDDIHRMKVIDLENCFIGASAHHSETLGFQFGFLYQDALNQFITETHYDALVNSCIGNLNDIDRLRFQPFYQRFKHQGADRKDRHLIPLRGLLIDGKPAKPRD